MSKIMTLIMIFLSVLNSFRTMHVQVKVPFYKFIGESAQLLCLYELGNNKVLYSVKWYKDNEEFYRYVPKSQTPYHSYQIDGVIVDTSFSDSYKINLLRLSLKSIGTYRCEVTAEAPFFESGESESRMEIISLATENPKIFGMKSKYVVDEIMQLNCSSGSSYPPPIVYWYINDNRIFNDKNTMIDCISETNENELIRINISLTLKIKREYFYDGVMKIGCVTYLYSKWYPDFNNVNNTELRKLEQLTLIDKREALLLVKSRSVRNSSALHISLLIGILHITLLFLQIV